MDAFWEPERSVFRISTLYIHSLVSFDPGIGVVGGARLDGGGFLLSLPPTKEKGKFVCSVKLCLWLSMDVCQGEKSFRQDFL